MTRYLIDKSALARAARKSVRGPLEVQRLLAESARHRGATIPDLLIAACAEAHNATVLHYDADTI